MELNLQNSPNFIPPNSLTTCTCTSLHVYNIFLLYPLSLFLLLLVRTMLLALVGFMPTDGKGTIGSLDCTPEARRQMAIR